HTYTSLSLSTDHTYTSLSLSLIFVHSPTISLSLSLSLSLSPLSLCPLSLYLSPSLIFSHAPLSLSLSHLCPFPHYLSISPLLSSNSVKEENREAIFLPFRSVFFFSFYVSIIDPNYCWSVERDSLGGVGDLGSVCVCVCVCLCGESHLHE